MKTFCGRIVVLVAAVVAAGCSAGGRSVRESDRVGGLGDTLSRIKAAKTIVLGYRESSPPFSFVREDGRPLGYSVELCAHVAASIARQLSLPDLKTTWVKVTVADRMQAVVNGTIDLECGSTTASLSRQEHVDFSLLTFVDGGSLLVTDESGVGSVRTLDGKRVALIPGTTTETSLRSALAKRGLTARIVPVTDHAAGVAALDGGTADAYASDRSILVGIGRTSRNPARLSLVDEFFSYEPYGLMLRRGDPAFRLAVNRALAALYRSADIVPIFERWFGSIPTATPLIAAMYVINGLPE
jgi:ABC-type amino acid transport substrate-binding protein